MIRFAFVLLGGGLLSFILVNPFAQVDIGYFETGSGSEEFGLRVKNRGLSKLVIKQISSNCNCVVVPVREERFVSPGGSVFMPVRVKVNEEKIASGSLGIQTNDFFQPLIFKSFDLRDVNYTLVEPSVLGVLENSFDPKRETYERIVSIFNSEGLIDCGMRESSKYVTTQFQRISDYRGRLVFLISPDPNSSSYNDTIWITLKSPSGETFHPIDIALAINR